ncbi:MAG TPA: cell wall-binding repeat-containing protein [Candidatus Limnocylindria bacterium]|nr:cell wall-binding repeat-containing protein [Candidatus Limnocylindria bacterium]
MLALLIGATLTLPLPSPARAGSPIADATAELAATYGGSPADYTLLYERTASVPLSGASVWAGKFLDRRSGEIRLVYRDVATGTTDGPRLLGQERAQAVAAVTALEAKGDAELRGAVTGRGPEQSVPVGVWLEVDLAAAEQGVIAAHPELAWDGNRPLVDDLETMRRIRAELWQARATALAPALDAFAAQVSALGGSVAYASTTAPLAYVDLPAGRVADLAALPEVASLGLERAWRTSMASAGPAVQADWTGGTEDQGNGVRVAVVEYHNVRNSGDLAGRVAASYSTSGSLAYTGAGTFDHPTWVAGAIAGRGTYPGVAPGALIVSASTGGGGASVTRDRQIIAAADWASNPAGGDADVISASIGQDTATGSEEARRYFDAFVDQGGHLAVAAAGNYSTFGHWDILSPGTAYNVLTVGGLDDRNTTDRWDDGIWYGSSNGSNYRDRTDAAWNTHGDYNKPNVSAPAASVVTANGLGASGTSVATPIVAGIAAQIIARVPTLALRPEAARAIIMAGAINHAPMPDGSLNADHEGTGSASALWANRLLNAGDGTYGGYRMGSMGAGETVAQDVAVTAGQRVKVVVTWNSRAAAGNDQLLADLDLVVIQPDGSRTGSYTIDNNYEWVEFVASGSGTARIEVRQSRFEGSSERYGLAWSKVNLGTPYRMAGVDRYATAATISSWHFAPGVPVAYVATGRNFPDALAVGPVAGLQRGPVLLTDPSSIPDSTRSELARLRPQRIVVVGGEGVVSPGVVSQLQAYTGQPVGRLAGPDRYATAAQVARASFSPGVPAVFVATGRTFPDALTAGPAAAALGGPVLLVDPTSIPQATADALAWLQPRKIYIVGGPGVVSDGVTAALQGYSAEPVARLWGADRFATAAAVAQAFFGGPRFAVYLATGRNFPDALTAVPAASVNGAPLLLVTQHDVPAPTAGELLRIRPARTYLAGGSGVVSDAVLGGVNWLLGKP